MGAFFESPREDGDAVVGASGWRPQLPERARRELASRRVALCCNCGGKTELGVNDRDELVCVVCFGNGGHGFAWHRS